MKRLLLLRHAKAVQDSTGGDHARALAPRGRRAAPIVGKAMRKRGYVPDRVLCSGAKRTRETWELVAPALKSEAAVEFSETVYLAPWRAIVNAVKETPLGIKTLMVVGHNPGMEDCAAALLRPEADDDERARRVMLAEKFPTGALAVIDCQIGAWDEIAPACGVLRDFVRPRDLE